MIGTCPARKLTREGAGEYLEGSVLFAHRRHDACCLGAFGKDLLSVAGSGTGP